MRGKVFKGIGLASKIGFPTINIINELNIESGLYLVNSSQYGNGVAFALPHICEIHFMKDLEFKDDYLECSIIQKVQPPNTNGVVDVFYNGIKAMNL
jgi:FAD synthase